MTVFLSYSPCTIIFIILTKFNKTSSNIDHISIAFIFQISIEKEIHLKFNQENFSSIDNVPPRYYSLSVTEFRIFQLISNNLFSSFPHWRSTDRNRRDPFKFETVSDSLNVGTACKLVVTATKHAPPSTVSVFAETNPFCVVAQRARANRNRFAWFKEFPICRAVVPRENYTFVARWGTSN